MTEVKRATRVGERLREELAWLVTREVRDPRLAGVIIVRVAMTDDLRTARVYVRLLEMKDEAHTKEVITGLTRARSMLRRATAMRMGLRYAPELTFFYDEGQEKRDRVDELLHEIKRDAAAPQ